MKRTTVTVFAALALAVLGLTFSSQQTATAGSKVYVKDLKHNPRIKPKNLFFGVGAGTILRFRDLKNWKHWNAPTTRVRGTFKYNDCIPSCAEGSLKKTGVKLKLSGISKCHGQRRYRKIHYNPNREGLATSTFRVDCAGIQDF